VKCENVAYSNYVFQFYDHMQDTTKSKSKKPELVILDKDVMLPAIKVFGNRIAITEIEEPIDGAIALPQNYQRTDYRLGRIVQAGKLKNSLKVGDDVLFQIPEQVKRTATYSYPAVTKGPNQFVIISADDVFGTLTDLRVSPETFVVSGDWVVLEMQQMKAPDSILTLPDNASIRLSDLHFEVLQLGDTVFKDKDGNPIEPTFAVGDKVFVERTRSTPIIFGTKELVIVHKDYVYGVQQ